MIMNPPFNEKEPLMWLGLLLSQQAMLTREMTNHEISEAAERLRAAENPEKALDNYLKEVGIKYKFELIDLPESKWSESEASCPSVMTKASLSDDCETITINLGKKLHPKKVQKVLSACLEAIMPDLC